MARSLLLLHSSAGRYGADLQLLTLVAGLDRSRFDPLVVLPERGQLAEPLEEAGAEVVLVPRLAIMRRAERGPRGMAMVMRKLREADRVLLPLAREREVALVHSNTSVILSGLRVARKLSLPHLMHVRELYPHTPVLWQLLRRGLMQADRLACVSRAVARQFPDASKAFVLYDGLPRSPRRAGRAEARAALGLEADRFVVALLGRVSDWKGQDVLARALAERALTDIGAVGLIVGDPWPGSEGPLRNLEALHTELGLRDRLRRLGFVDDVETVLGAADAVAVPSTRPDPFPNSALEAAAAGVPVVASAHGGLPEMLRDGETGLLVQPGDHVALAKALRELADDPARARRMGEAAAADVARRFPRERLLARVHETYEDLL